MNDNYFQKRFDQGGGYSSAMGAATIAVAKAFNKADLCMRHHFFTDLRSNVTLYMNQVQGWGDEGLADLERKMTSSMCEAIGSDHILFTFIDYMLKKVLEQMLQDARNYERNPGENYEFLDRCIETLEQELKRRY